MVLVTLASTLHQHNHALLIGTPTASHSLSRTAALHESVASVGQQAGDTDDHDCAICQLLASGALPGPVSFFTVTLAIIAALIIATRLMALWQVPTPRGSLRAPPAFCS